MERSKYLVILLLLFLGNESFANTSYREKVYSAYIQGNMGLWRNIIIELEITGKASSEKQFELLDYYYGYIAWCIGNDRKQEARVFLNKANILLASFDKNETFSKSTLMAYEAAFIGFRIGIEPYRAPVIGVKSQQLAREAFNNDNTNPFAVIEQGNVLYFSPAMFGGSKSEARKHFEKAVELFEDNPDNLSKNWRYLNTLVFLLQVYVNDKDIAKAKLLKQKIHRIEPEFKWVKEIS